MQPVQPQYIIPPPIHIPIELFIIYTIRPSALTPDLSSRGYAELTVRLPRHHLRDRVSNNHTRLLRLLLRQASRNAHLQRRL